MLFRSWSAKLTDVRASSRGQAVHTLVGGTPVDFDWDPARHKYLRLIGGVPQLAADGHAIATPNVIVQYCKVSVHPGDVDVAGNPAQYTHSIGRGKVVVFRNGKRIDGTWSRPSARAGTKLLTAGRKRIPLAPGGAWVILVASGAPLS